MLTPREQFLALVYNGPLMTADAIVLLAGEDAAPRADVAAGLFLREAAPSLLITGLPKTTDHRTGAEDTAVKVMAHGVAPNRITVDRKATNTREQAVTAVALATGQSWRRILLIASAYHVPRAVLTFVREVDATGADLHVVPVPASHAPWFGVPERMQATRLELLAREMEKCDEYAARGDCATFEAGIAYLRKWEGR